jgi:hypothetical protein
MKETSPFSRDGPAHFAMLALCGMGAKLGQVKQRKYRKYTAA